MKELNIIQTKIACLAVIFVVGFISCKKDEIESPPIASLTLVNTITGGQPVQLGSFVSPTLINNYSQFGLAVGEHQLYIWPSGDSLNPYFTSSKFTVQQGEAYSLFLGGTPSAVDGIIVKENFSKRTDSTTGIRFINLSPNSSPLNITLSTSPTVNEVSNLAYKHYTEFKNYPANNSNEYTFQVRNGSGNLLASLRFRASNFPRFSNITLVIRGMMNGSPAMGITSVKNDR